MFLAPIATSLAFWAVAPSRWLVNDSTDYSGFYEPVAREIAAGHGIVTPDLKPAILYPPAYPILLAGCFRVAQMLAIQESAVLLAARLMAHGLAGALLFAIASGVWGPRLSIVTGIAWAAYPLGLWLMKQPNSEAPFFVVFYSAVWLLLSVISGFGRGRREAFGIGILIGLAMLLRPIAIGLGAVMALILVIQRGRGGHARRGLGLAALVLLGNVLIVAPWEAWVYARTGRVILLQAGSVQPIRDGMLYARRHAGPNAARAASEIDARWGPDIRSTSDVVRLLIAETRRSPRAMLALYAWKAARAWYGTDTERFETEGIVLQLFCVALFLWSSVAAWRSNPTFTAVVWTFVLYFWCMAIVAFTLVRYMIPGIGLLFTLLPAGLASFARRTSPVGMTQPV